jgi:hypothetical protein
VGLRLPFSPALVERLGIPRPLLRAIWGGGSQLNQGVSRLMIGQSGPIRLPRTGDFGLGWPRLRIVETYC